MQCGCKSVTTLEEARRFIVDCFKAVGVSEEYARIVSDNLVEADYRGHYSHGMNRLELYINDILGGTVDPKAVCSVEKQSAATALVNGNNCLGAVVGKFCMDLALEKARDAGIGMVVVHGSNHFGINQIYTVQAAKKGFMGFSFTNTSPIMVPTRAKDAALGTNPLSFAAPGLNGDSFILDMSTACVAMGKIEMRARKGQSIPEGWALNSQGKVETDAKVAKEAGRLLPLGGEEINSGYKGYGLGLMVETLCGILSGSAFGPNIRRWGREKAVANLGQAFIAINPNNFAPGFEGRLSTLMDYLRNMAPVESSKPVFVHGDMERTHMSEVDKRGGLLYVSSQLETNAQLAKKLNVSPMGGTMKTK
ncbi:uncharacterized protein LOC108913205 [Anoplophora glabripennis]|uniref:uncharacterized protein LOC108913205 n=1 Tax=Anoplophora glabripennis TaxID=217634 RepID=UPI000874931D|nr:uncharacterized protein LOC108913205 [Anoplophora glabripennis]